MTNSDRLGFEPRESSSKPVFWSTDSRLSLWRRTDLLKGLYLSDMSCYSENLRRGGQSDCPGETQYWNLTPLLPTATWKMGRLMPPWRYNRRTLLGSKTQHPSTLPSIFLCFWQTLYVPDSYSFDFHLAIISCSTCLTRKHLHLPSFQWKDPWFVPWAVRGRGHGSLCSGGLGKEH